jgi:hypothetical protein
MITLSEPEIQSCNPALRRRFGLAHECAAAGICILVVTLLSVLPHLIAWVMSGHPYSVYENDDYSIYAPIASDAYFNHPSRISDPFSPGDRPTYFPSLMFVPGVLLAKAFGIGPLGVQFFWRLLAGVGLSAGGYALARHHLGRPWLSSVLVLFLLCDIGFSWRLPVVRQFLMVLQSVVGPWPSLPMSLRFKGGDDEFHSHLRVINPGLSLGFVWLHLFLLSRAREHPSRRSLVLSGLSFGLLFYVYFYYWTAVGLTLGLCWLFDACRRRVYFHTLWIGVLTGLPSVVSSVLFKRGASADWGPRVDLFLPIGRTSELNVPKLTILALALLLPWIWLRRRQFLPAWLLLFSAFLLSNHQLITGLQTESYHWSWCLLSPGFTFLLGLVAVDLIATRVRLARRVVLAASVLLVLHIGAGFWMRGITSIEFARSNRDMLTDYIAQRLSPDGPRLRPSATIAGDQKFSQFAQILENQRALDSPGLMFSPFTDNATWNERSVLNAFLLGYDSAAFEESQYRARRDMAQNEGFAKGPWVRDPALGRERIRSRLALYDKISRTPDEALRRYGVQYVALPVGSPPPAYLARGWKPFQSGPKWAIWEREARVEPGLESISGVGPASPGLNLRSQDDLAGPLGQGIR